MSGQRHRLFDHEICEGVFLRLLSPAIAQQSIDDLCVISGRFVNSKWQVGVSSALLALLVGREEPLVKIDDLGPSDYAQVLELVFAAFLEQMEDLLAGRIECADIQLAPKLPFSSNFAGCLTWQGREIPFLARFEDDSRRRLEEWTRLLPSRVSNFRGLSVSVAFRYGMALLSLNEVRGLTVGDAIIATIPYDLGATSMALAVAGETFCSACRLIDNKARVETAFTECPNGWLRYFMRDDTRGATADLPMAGSIGEIPVQLFFDIGRIELAISELETISVGYEFNLERPANQMVEIVAGGRIFAFGEVVRLDRDTTVKITRLLP
jgi:type III secretion system YscQ/HrcQ family protein